MILDVSFGGLLLFKTTDEVITIIEFITSINLQSQHRRTQA